MNEQLHIRMFRRFRLFRKGKVMTRETNKEGIWASLFEEQHSRLSEVAEVLLYRNVSPEQILKKALAELEGRPFRMDFGLACAMRAVVKAAIAYNHRDTDSRVGVASSGPVIHVHSGPLPLEALPWAERAVYFLRDVLRYSRRDTAILLGMSDAEVDQLNRFAGKRMGVQAALVKQSRNRAKLALSE
jgi:hypothetical protein